MNIFKELELLYNEIDNIYAQKEFNARASGWHKKEKKWARKRELNDHAYFLFMFTRLEDYIREQSSKLIEKKQTSLTSWKQKRVWGILPKDKDSDKIYFLNRAALLVDKGSHHYQKIKDYYYLRNTLGHGGIFSSPVSIPNVVVDFEELIKMLKV